MGKCNIIAAVFVYITNEAKTNRRDNERRKKEKD